MAVALFDSDCTKPEDYKFRFVLRSDFTVYARLVTSSNCVPDLTVVLVAIADRPKINLLFECNAALLKDPFGSTPCSYSPVALRLF